jgi:hypothetical protein
MTVGEAKRRRQFGQPKLGLYEVLLPAAVRQFRASADTVALHHLSTLGHATVFDCRPLPIEMVRDTGYAAFEELEQTGQLVRLPHPVCYFEFADTPETLIRAIVAEEIAVTPDRHLSLTPDTPEPPDSLGAYVRVCFYFNWSLFVHAGQPIAPLIEQAIELGLVDEQIFEDQGVFLTNLCGDFSNNVLGEDVPFFDAGLMFRPKDADPESNWSHQIDEMPRERVREAGITLVGVLALLQDKLLLQHFEPDPTAWWSRQRLAKRKLPTSGDSYVLTVNVPAVRYAVSRNAIPLRTHESPCLHWRRGHSRTLHRGSEFESTTWVRRCLVGDPDKGFVAPQYRLTSRLPMPSEVIH